MFINIIYNLLFVIYSIKHYNNLTIIYYKIYKDIEEAEINRASVSYC